MYCLSTCLWKKPSIPNYITISIRINKLDIEVENDAKSKEFKDEYIIIAIDITGIRVTSRGQWMEEINGMRKRKDI
jgi:hypothetical protein